MSGLSLGTCVSNLKSVALTVLNWSDWPFCCARTHTRTHTHTQTDRHTSNENSISVIHFVHLPQIKIEPSTFRSCAVDVKCKMTVIRKKSPKMWVCPLISFGRERLSKCKGNFSIGDEPTSCGEVSRKSVQKLQKKSVEK